MNLPSQTGDQILASFHHSKVTCFSSSLLQNKDFLQNPTQLFQVETWGELSGKCLWFGSKKVSFVMPNWEHIAWKTLFSCFMYQFFFGGSILFDPLLTDLFLGEGKQSKPIIYLIGKQRLLVFLVDKLPPLVTVCTNCFLFLRLERFENVKLIHSPPSSVEKIHLRESCSVAATRLKSWFSGIIRLKYTLHILYLMRSDQIPLYFRSRHSPWRSLESTGLTLPPFRADNWKWNM